MKLRTLRRAGAALLTLALACSLLAVPALADDPAPPALTGITLSSSSLSLDLYNNKTGTITAAPVPAGAALPTLTRESSEPTVATVSDGTVTAKKVGNATITATWTSGNGSNLTSSACAVTVSDSTPVNVSVTGVTLDKHALTLTAGGSGDLHASVNPPNASNKEVTWTSSSNQVTVHDNQNGDATVSASSSITSELTAIVTAKTTDGGYTDSCTVTVRPAPPDLSNISVSLDLNPPGQGISIPLGGTHILKATITGVPEGSSKSLAWSSTSPGKIGYRFPNTDDTTTVEIYLTGSAKEDDQATISVSSLANPNKSAACAVRVVREKASKISSVEITTAPNSSGRNYVDPGKGNTLRLQAVAYPASAPEEDRRIVWSSSDTSVATVDPNTGVVTGRAPGEAVIRATASGDSTKYAERTVEVSGLLLSYLKKSSSGGQGTTISLTPSTEVEIFQYKDIVVSYKAFGNAQNKLVNWESSNPTVAQVVSGRVTGNYPGSGVVITAVAEGTANSASFKVRVVGDVADAITVDMGSSPSYPLSGVMSQLNSRSQSKAGAPLDYVYSLKVSTKNGILYYKYNTAELPGHGVGGTERYYYQPSGQQMGLRDVTFVPLPGFDGVAVVDYIGMATNGTSFTGTIRIEADASGTLSYTTGAGQPVSFTSDYFADICKGRTGKAIRYVTFTQPAASQGALYYNYSASGQFSQKVNSATRYYASSSPSIDNITFVPAEGYAGTVDIAYRCVDSAGASFSGTITIRVGGTGGSAPSGNTVVYYLNRDQAWTLNVVSFNEVCLRATGLDLNYIRFHSLPSSSFGTLYLNYAGGSGARVSAANSYYRTGSPRISDITFVPASGYSGTVTIPFTGANTKGTTFTGSLVFHVAVNSGGSSSASGVHYTGCSLPINFQAGDFQAVCQAALGNPLSYVQFGAAPAVGRLYKGYASPAQTGLVVNAVTHYNVQDLGQISYVPKAEYQGTLTIPYTMHDTAGGSKAGAVTLQLSNSYCQPTFTDTVSGWDWAKPSIEYLRDSGITSGYRNNTYRPSQPISRGEFTLMICRAFQFPTTGVSTFRDVPASSTYAGAIASAQNLGIVEGSNGRFRPDQPITRQSAMTMICRAIRAAGQSLPDADTGLLSSYVDGGRVSAHARTSVAALIQMGAVRGNSASRLNPGAAISRAEMAVILHRVLTR